MPRIKPGSASKSGSKGGGGNSNKRNSSYNARGAGGKGRTGGLAAAGQNNKNKKPQHGGNGGGGGSKNGRRRLLNMRADKTIREQPFEFVVMIHAETALECPLQQAERAKALDNTTTQERLAAAAAEAEAAAAATEHGAAKKFDSKQIVQLAFCVLHTPSGTVCGRMQSLVRPPPQAEALSQYCLNTLGIASREAVETAAPLVDVMRAAERWIRRVVEGRNGDADAVYDLDEKRRTATAAAPSATAAAAAAASSSSDDDDEEGEEEEEEDSADDEEEEENDGDDDAGEQAEAAAAKAADGAASSANNNGNDADGAAASSGAAPTVHTIILGADGITTIAAIFQGNQQYMPSASSTSSAASNADQPEQQLQSKFSHLHLLNGDIFHRWIDVRESFHRYFRVPATLRFNFSDMLREIGLSYSGRGHCAVDKTKNMAHLMVAMMKKGCIFSFPMQCRTRQEHIRAHAQHGQAGTLVVGDSSAAAAAAVSAASSSKAAGSSMLSSAAQLQSVPQQRRVALADLSNYLASTADVVQMRKEGAAIAANKSRFSPIRLRGADPDASLSSGFGAAVALFFAVTLSQVFVRWLLFAAMTLGIAWNIWQKRARIDIFAVAAN